MQAKTRAGQPPDRRTRLRAGLPVQVASNLHETQASSLHGRPPFPEGANLRVPESGNASQVTAASAVSGCIQELRGLFEKHRDGRQESRAQ